MPTVMVVDANSGVWLKTVTTPEGNVVISHEGYSSQTVYVSGDTTVGLIPRFRVL